MYGDQFGEFVCGYWDLRVKVPYAVGSDFRIFLHLSVVLLKTAARLAQLYKRRSTEREAACSSPVGPTLRVFK